jgi:Tfp pilus assembly protein PilX
MGGIKSKTRGPRRYRGGCLMVTARVLWIVTVFVVAGMIAWSLP